jgi:hypothetical protein
MARNKTPDSNRNESAVRNKASKQQVLMDRLLQLLAIGSLALTLGCSPQSGQQEHRRGDKTRETVAKATQHVKPGLEWSARKLGAAAKWVADWTDSRRLTHSVNSYLISASSSVQLTSRLPWFPWHNIAAYKARFQNTITVRFSAGLRRCSDTRRSSVGIKVFERLLGSNA